MGSDLQTGSAGCALISSDGVLLHSSITDAHHVLAQASKTQNTLLNYIQSLATLCTIYPLSPLICDILNHRSGEWLPEPWLTNFSLVAEMVKLISSCY